MALSARLDGEDPGMPAATLDAHAVGCPACRSWLSRAERIKRTLRVQVADVPDLTASVLAAVAADPRSAAGSRSAADPQSAAARAAAARGRRQILRIAVAVAAVAQFAVALPLLFPALGVTVDPHTTREMASFDIALAVGFALAAYRPERARAFVPVAFVLAACLVVTSAVDVATSATALVHEISHLSAAVQAGLLWALGRAERGGSPSAPVIAAGRG